MNNHSRKLSCGESYGYNQRETVPETILQQNLTISLEAQSMFNETVYKMRPNHEYRKSLLKIQYKTSTKTIIWLQIRTFIRSRRHTQKLKLIFLSNLPG